jgi:leader peptidase (prepilin peptidase) / N-methyltransferase
MLILEALQTTPWFFYAAITFTGLAVGSFLNVVIYRLPVILEKEWTHQCQEFLEQEVSEQKKFNLAFPASTCPKCKHEIRFWENIPVLSYLFLQGKCASCKTHISVQYPIVEASTAILSIIVAHHFGVSWQTVAALMLTWSLIALTMIDVHKQLLPDNITLPLLWLGIICNMSGLFTDLESSVKGAIFGYLALWSIYHLFKIVTGKEGMGYGDFKLLGALGAWMGWKVLPIIIVLSSFVGAVIGIAMIVFTRHDKSVPIPFGPYLAIAGGITLLWGDAITKAWLGPF